MHTLSPWLLPAGGESSALPTSFMSRMADLLRVVLRQPRLRGPEAAAGATAASAAAGADAHQQHVGEAAEPITSAGSLRYAGSAGAAGGGSASSGRFLGTLIGASPSHHLSGSSTADTKGRRRRGGSSRGLNRKDGRARQEGKPRSRKRAVGFVTTTSDSELDISSSGSGECWATPPDLWRADLASPPPLCLPCIQHPPFYPPLAPLPLLATLQTQSAPPPPRLPPHPPPLPAHPPWKALGALIWG